MDVIMQKATQAVHTIHVCYQVLRTHIYFIDLNIGYQHWFHWQQLTVFNKKTSLDIKYTSILFCKRDIN